MVNYEERTCEKALGATQVPYGMGRFSQVFARWGGTKKLSIEVPRMSEV